MTVPKMLKSAAEEVMEEFRIPNIIGKKTDTL